APSGYGMWQAESGHSSCEVQPTHVFASASHSGVVPVHALVTVAEHCTHSLATHAGISGNLPAHAASGSSFTEQGAQSMLTQKGAPASAQSSLVMQPMGPSSLERLGSSVAPIVMPESVSVPSPAVVSRGRSSAVSVDDELVDAVVASV